MKLLLASQSSTRRDMLERAGVPFEVVAADCDEEAAKAQYQRQGCSAAALAEALAEVKARSAPADAEQMVLGADQVLERADGTMLSKPRNPEDLAGQLRSLSGRMHQLHSAAVLVRAGEVVWRGMESVRMTMRDLSESFLADYVAREWAEVRWSVGGYRIEGSGAQLFDRIDGSHFAILGLPLLPLLAELRRHGLVTS